MINDIGSIANGISIVKSNKQKSPPQGTRSVSKGVYLMKGERTPSIPKSLLWDGDFSADLALSLAASAIQPCISSLPLSHVVPKVLT